MRVNVADAQKQTLMVHEITGLEQTLTPSSIKAVY